MGRRGRRQRPVAFRPPDQKHPSLHPPPATSTSTHLERPSHAVPERKGALDVRPLRGHAAQTIAGAGARRRSIGQWKRCRAAEHEEQNHVARVAERRRGTVFRALGRPDTGLEAEDERGDEDREGRRGGAG